jgi:hypothetical protein
MLNPGSNLVRVFSKSSCKVFSDISNCSATLTSFIILLNAFSSSGSAAIKTYFIMLRKIFRNYFIVCFMFFFVTIFCSFKGEHNAIVKIKPKSILGKIK